MSKKKNIGKKNTQEPIKTRETNKNLNLKMFNKKEIKIGILFKKKRYTKIKN